jgi:hypothetical protein
LRVLAIADSDSYLKWAAATVAALPDDAARGLVLVACPAAPSAPQRAAALRGTGISPDAVPTLPITSLAARVAEEAPDVVLVATRGPQARVILRELARLDPRPVLVSGLPGISVPATRKALYFRHQADLFVVHSHREVREFRALASRNAWSRAIALASLPFAASGGVPEPAVPGGTDLVFAVQSIVPAEPAERRLIARMLLRAAEAAPERRVVVKVRAVAGERQTHDESHPIPELIAAEAAATRRPMPPNLVISSTSMSAALDTAEGLVTVSSTAAIEAIARGIPVIALDMFGISDALINPVFSGSGLFGGEDDVVGRRFRHPSPRWLHDDYFHPVDDDDLHEMIRELVAARRAGELAPRDALPVAGGSLRHRWQRGRAFPGSESNVRGLLVAAVGHPARAVVVVSRKVTKPIRVRQHPTDQTP